MQHRYALRFENGERRGETVALGPGGLTVGRKRGNSLQVLDASVSGRHAEIVVDAQGCLLRDLGSTNGTRLGAERVSERRLAPGDQVLFGNVRMLFFDAAVQPAPPPTEPSAVDTAGLTGSLEAVGEEMHTISADKVARSRRRSPLVLATLALALAAGGAFVFLRGRERGSGGPLQQVEPVAAVQGNLLSSSYSFEEGTTAWEGESGAPAAFEVDPGASRTGRLGLRAELPSGAWALALSEPASLGRAPAIRVHGFVRAAAGAEALLGVELSSSTGAAAPTRVFAPPYTGADLAEREVSFQIPPVFDSARALLLGRALAASSPGVAGGAEGAGAFVDADDVDLTTPPSAGQAAPKFGETQLFLLGSPATAGVLFRIDRALISALSVRGGDGPAAPRAALSAEPAPNGLRLRVEAPEGAERAVLSFAVEGGLAAGGIATLGPADSAQSGKGAHSGDGAQSGDGAEAGSRRVHQVEFRREGAASCLLGSGRDLVRLVFDAPCAVSGRPEDGLRPGGGLFALEVELGASRGLLVQLAFRDEHGEAVALARSAAAAQGEGRLGEAVALWARVENELPFDSEILERATAARARLVQAGLAEMQALAAGVERARFFRLPAPMRASLAAARALEGRYAGCEIAAQVRGLEAGIQRELDDLEADLHAAERKRLIGIERALLAREERELAERVRAYRVETFGPEGGER